MTPPIPTIISLNRILTDGTGRYTFHIPDVAASRLEHLYTRETSDLWMMGPVTIINTQDVETYPECLLIVTIVRDEDGPLYRVFGLDEEGHSAMYEECR